MPQQLLNCSKVLKLDGEEFVRRYLQHILPKGLMRIRHYGFLANRCRREKLARIRERLAQAAETGVRNSNDDNVRYSETDKGYLCPVCKTGHLRLIAQRRPHLGTMKLTQRR